MNMQFRGGTPTCDRDAQAQVALSKVESLVHHNQVGVPECKLREHVIPDNPQVQVACAHLANDVRSALEPDLNGRDLQCSRKAQQT